MEFYKKEMARIREEGEAEIERALAQPPPSNDYTTKVEKLQEKVSCAVIIMHCRLVLKPEANSLLCADHGEAGCYQQGVREQERQHTSHCVP